MRQTAASARFKGSTAAVAPDLKAYASHLSCGVEAVTTAMKVVIVGGSLVGLMHGIMFRDNGCDVHIIEQTAGTLEGQGAGLGTGMHIKPFLDLHDRLQSSFSFPCKGVRVTNTKDQVISEIPVTTAMTSWDVLYFRLRANFDSLVSVYYPDPPSGRPGDGEVLYETGQKLTSLYTGPDKMVTVQYQDVRTGTTSTLSADLVIGADGANSTVRSLVHPTAPERRYAGYVMWRGIIPERELTTETATQGNEWFTLYPAPLINEYFLLQSCKVIGHSKPASNMTCVYGYKMPGKHGNLDAGHLGMNLVWYSHVTPDELARILVDIDGHRHHWSVPAGKLDPAVWQRQLDRAMRAGGREEPVHASCREIVASIREPFLQAISDYPASRAAFHDGRVLLVGDALCLLRPHTGLGTSQGALHAMLLEKALFADGQASRDGIAEWEKQVLEFARVQGLRSVSWGMFYLGGWTGWLPAAARYHGALQAKKWWAWAAGWLGLVG